MALRPLVIATLAIFGRSAGAQAIDPTICENQNFPYFCAMAITPAAFEFGNISWGDFNRDGRQDIVFSGNRVTREQPEPRMQFLRNVGEFAVLGEPPDETKPPSVTYETRYAEIGASASLAPSQEVWDGASLLTDLDGDGKLDIAVTGRDDVDEFKTLIFRNTYGASLEFAELQRLSGVVQSAMASGDFDNDGDVDLVAVGTDADGVPRAHVFRNEIRTSGVFVDSPNSIEGVSLASVDVADFDGDQDLDIVIAGKTADNDSITRIYVNEGGTFVDSGISLPGLLFAKARFVDVDGDNDYDLVLSGARLSPFVLSSSGLIFENVGNSFVQSGTFQGRYYGGLTSGDIDGDGAPDLLVGGGTRLSDPANTDFLSNTGSGSFERRMFFGGGLFGQIVVGDYDGDLDLDILFFGKLTTGGNLFREYRNEGAPPNTPPAAPTNVQSSVDGAEVTFAWDASVDAETGTSGLTYNVRVGSGPGLDDVQPSNAMPDGRRLISAKGNVEMSTGWHLSALPSGTYYWSVQALDGSFAGSAFSVEQTFVIP